MSMSIASLLPALPEIVLALMACVILIVDVAVGARLRGLAYMLAQLSLLAAVAIVFYGFAVPAAVHFHGMFVDDMLARVLKLAVYGIVFVVFLYSRDYIAARGMYRGEYFVLGLLGAVGMSVMISAAHFLALYLGLELLSLSLYAMVAFQRDSAVATEAAMKYFVLGALASGMLLYGMSMLYGATGSLVIAEVAQRVASAPVNDPVLVFGLVFVIVGMAFKLGAVPFHMWIPDVYQGAPTAVTLYIASAPKLAAFAMLMRLLIAGLAHLAGAWQEMLIVMAVLSMAVGNVIAIAQTNFKRMLAYSTISHMGFFLLGMLSASPNGYGSALFYMLIYVLMGLGSFGMILLLSRQGFEAENLDDLKGLNQRSPWYAFLLLLLMFSMAGVPPTAGFYAKLAVIQAVIDAGFVWLAVVAVLLSVIGAFYYLRVVKLMYFDAPADATPIAARRDLRLVLSLNGLVMIALTPGVGYVMSLCRDAIRHALL